MANELAPDICPHGIGPGACDSREQCSLRWSRGDRGTLIESVQRSPEAKCTPASDWGCEARRKLGVARGALQAIADGEGADEQAFDWSEFHDSIKRQAREAFEATARPAKCPETPKRTRAPEARPWPSGWVVTGSSEGHYRWRAIGPWRESRSEAESDVVRTETATADETERLRTALGKLNEIRNSIIGIQGFNFSEHAYPMVAALDEAGFEGLPYPEARANVGTLIERATKAEMSLEIARSMLRKLGKCRRCNGDGEYLPTCFRCDDSTDDHECPGPRACDTCEQTGLAKEAREALDALGVLETGSNGT